MTDPIRDEAVRVLAAALYEASPSDIEPEDCDYDATVILHASPTLARRLSLGTAWDLAVARDKECPCDCHELGAVGCTDCRDGWHVCPACGGTIDAAALARRQRHRRGVRRAVTRCAGTRTGRAAAKGTGEAGLCPCPAAPEREP